jgi:transcriptional regulator GlxA family with amidase domain
VLPPVVYFPAASEQAAILRATIGLLAHEAGAVRLGRTNMLDRLAQVVLIHALRACAEEAPSGGWLVAALDPQLGPALRAMHDDIAHAWSIRELAAHARMSRSTFSLKFKAAVGATPLDHLLRMRVHTAARALRETDRTVAAVAAAVGYGTESAFSVAFKRVTGLAPGEYRLRAATRTAVEPVQAS